MRRPRLRVVLIPGALILGGLILTVGLSLAAPAVAAPPPKGAPKSAAKGAPKGDPQYKKETRYDFDDDLVEGELQRPDDELIEGSRRTKHSSLIKIREHFIPELLKSAEDL
jgi:hypothetical protein